MLDVYIYEPFAQDSEKQIRRHFIKRECFFVCFVLFFLFFFFFVFCLFVCLFFLLSGEIHTHKSPTSSFMFVKPKRFNV